jgi:predicted ArsR family transcriptional regulator
MGNNLRETLLAYFKIIPSASAEEVAHDLGLGQREIQQELIAMDEADLLRMRNGWYSIMERARKDGR